MTMPRRQLVDVAVTRYYHEWQEVSRKPFACRDIPMPAYCR